MMVLTGGFRPLVSLSADERCMERLVSEQFGGLFHRYYVAVWKKADGGYELAGQIGDVAHQAQGSTSVSICWNKDVDYYIQIVSDSKETFRLDVSWTLEITRPEVPSDVTVSGADRKNRSFCFRQRRIKMDTVYRSGRWKV